MSFIYVFIGGGLGAVARYWISLCIRTNSNGFPWATLSANLVSSFILGLLLGLVINKGLSNNQQLLLMTGFCGGFSTFSTFSMEAFTLFRGGHIVTASVYIVSSVLICLIAIGLGVLLTSRYK